MSGQIYISLFSFVKPDDTIGHRIRDEATSLIALAKGGPETTYSGIALQRHGEPTHGRRPVQQHTGPPHEGGLVRPVGGRRPRAHRALR